MFLSLVKWLLVNLGGLLLALLPAEEPVKDKEFFKWDAFADCGCHYLYKEDGDGEGHIFVAPCDTNTIHFWEDKTLDWFNFNLNSRDEGHADLTNV